MADNSSHGDHERVDAENAAMERFRRRSDEALSQQARRRFPDTIALLQDRWHRFSNAARWEKVILLAGVAIAVIGITIVAGALLRGGNSRPDVATQIVAPTAGTGRSATAEPTAERLPTTTPLSEPLLVNRQDCGTILGTAYLSTIEREWFLAQCQVAPSSVSLEPAGSEELFSSGATETATSVSAPAIASPYNVTRIDAIALAVAWLSTSGIDPPAPQLSECTASHVSDLWLVICQVPSDGCGDAVCSSWRSVCVTDGAGVILLNDAC